MKKQLCICTAAALMTLSGNLSASEIFQIDPNHTFVEWHINHIGFSNPSGKWFAKGTVNLDKDKLENSKVDVKINVADIVTGIPQLDKHLKGEQFFDVKKYPDATFVSDKIVVDNNNISKIQGTLTVHGIAKPVVLEVKMNKMGKNPINDQETIGFSGQTELKRSDFGMNTLVPALGDEVKLNIELEANLPKGK